MSPLSFRPTVEIVFELIFGGKVRIWAANALSGLEVK